MVLYMSYAFQLIYLFEKYLLILKIHFVHFE